MAKYAAALDTGLTEAPPLSSPPSAWRRGRSFLGQRGRPLVAAPSEAAARSAAHAAEPSSPSTSYPSRGNRPWGGRTTSSARTNPMTPPRPPPSAAGAVEQLPPPRPPSSAAGAVEQLPPPRPPSSAAGAMEQLPLPAAPSLSSSSASTCAPFGRMLESSTPTKMAAMSALSPGESTRPSSSASSSWQAPRSRTGSDWKGAPAPQHKVKPIAESPSAERLLMSDPISPSTPAADWPMSREEKKYKLGFVHTPMYDQVDLVDFDAAGSPTNRELRFAEPPGDVGEEEESLAKPSAEEIGFGLLSMPTGPRSAKPHWSARRFGLLDPMSSSRAALKEEPEEALEDGDSTAPQEKPCKEQQSAQEEIRLGEEEKERKPQRVGCCQGRSKPLQRPKAIVVRESDLRRHNGDLESLRETHERANARATKALKAAQAARNARAQREGCRILPRNAVRQDVDEDEARPMTAGEAFEMRCREPVELVDPWRGMENPWANDRFQSHYSACVIQEVYIPSGHKRRMNVLEAAGVALNAPVVSPPPPSANTSCCSASSMGATGDSWSSSACSGRRGMPLAPLSPGRQVSRSMSARWGGGGTGGSVPLSPRGRSGAKSSAASAARRHLTRLVASVGGRVPYEVPTNELQHIRAVQQQAAVLETVATSGLEGLFDSERTGNGGLESEVEHEGGGVDLDVPEGSG
eukprot:TRINITY_DN22393_c0_g2_i1.p1 TRINITY_DN22393_c0_g2~~TRINITY_DN22393_c0_g2_i1.p1  ORF type:complete len:691 (-),score=129.27 TRINITY_DN22393_c0_g2_i1:140-2212(-)